jgi:hypothetical protein
MEGIGLKARDWRENGESIYNGGEPIIFSNMAALS